MFDAASELETPDLNRLLEYDVLIWYTSNDGVDLQFWEGMDQDYEILKSYVSEGKILWVVGNDFLFDRHSTGATFDAGSFEHNFLGIFSYDAQSNEMIAANMESVIGFFSQLLVSAESTYLPTKSISISPNPVFESINVTSNIEGEIKVSVFSSSGKLMQMKRINQNGLINVADLPKGTYYIQFSSAKQSETQSFIKI